MVIRVDADDKYRVGTQAIDARDISAHVPVSKIVKCNHRGTSIGQN